MFEFTDRLTIEDLRRAKEALKKANVPMYYVSFPCDPEAMCGINPVSLGCCKEQSAPAPAKRVRPKDVEKDTMRTMYEEVTVANTDTNLSRQYLKDRLEDVSREHKKQLRKDFFIDEPAAPKTATEALALIAAGKFLPIDPVKDAAKAESDWSYSWSRAIDWRTKPADTIGFVIAEDALTKARRDTRDAIMALEPAKGLDALNAFKAQTFH